MRSQAGYGVTTSFPIPFDQLVFLHPPLVRASSSKGSATAMSMLSFGLHWLDLLVGRVSAWGGRWPNSDRW
jgi:hypothetical protein